MDVFVYNNVIKHSEYEHEYLCGSNFSYHSKYLKFNMFGQSDEHGLLMIRVNDYKKILIYAKQEWTISYYKSLTGKQKIDHVIYHRTDSDYSDEFDLLDKNIAEEIRLFLDTDLSDDEIIAFYNKLDLFMDRLLSIVTNIDYYSLWSTSNN